MPGNNQTALKISVTSFLHKLNTLTRLPQEKGDRYERATLTIPLPQTWEVSINRWSSRGIGNSAYDAEVSNGQLIVKLRKLKNPKSETEQFKNSIREAITNKQHKNFLEEVKRAKNLLVDCVAYFDGKIETKDLNKIIEVEDILTLAIDKGVTEPCQNQSEL